MVHSNNAEEKQQQQQRHALLKNIPPSLSLLAPGLRPPKSGHSAIKTNGSSTSLPDTPVVLPLTKENLAQITVLASDEDPEWKSKRLGFWLNDLFSQPAQEHNEALEATSRALAGQSSIENPLSSLENRLLTRGRTDSRSTNSMRRHHTVAFTSHHIKTIQDIWRDISAGQHKLKQKRENRQQQLSSNEEGHGKHVFRPTTAGGALNLAEEENDEIDTRHPAINISGQLDFAGRDLARSDGGNVRTLSNMDDEDLTHSTITEENGDGNEALLQNNLNVSDAGNVVEDVPSKKDLFDEMGDMLRKQRKKSTRKLKAMARRLNDVFKRKKHTGDGKSNPNAIQRAASTDTGAEMWGVKV